MSRIRDIAPFLSFFFIIYLYLFILLFLYCDLTVQYTQSNRDEHFFFSENMMYCLLKVDLYRIEQGENGQVFSNKIITGNQSIQCKWLNLSKVYNESLMFWWLGGVFQWWAGSGTRRMLVRLRRACKSMLMKRDCVLLKTIVLCCVFSLKGRQFVSSGRGSCSAVIKIDISKRQTQVKW